LTPRLLGSRCLLFLFSLFSLFFPLRSSTRWQVLAKVKEALENDKEKKITLLLLDHIISPLGMILPMVHTSSLPLEPLFSKCPYFSLLLFFFFFGDSPLRCGTEKKELVEIAHQHGARVLIDGAHVVGQIPLNLSELDADYFVSNCHKWLYSPRGCAFAWFVAFLPIQHFCSETELPSVSLFASG